MALHAKLDELLRVDHRAVQTLRRWTNKNLKRLLATAMPRYRRLKNLGEPPPRAAHQSRALTRLLAR
jgi:hypothetical protein